MVQIMGDGGVQKVVGRAGGKCWRLVVKLTRVEWRPGVEVCSASTCRADEDGISGAVSARQEPRLTAGSWR